MVHKGRVVTTTLKWLLERGSVGKDETYCLHMRLLDESCPECKAETADVV